MNRQFMIENNKERERLQKLVSEMTDEELAFIIYKEGWTVAVALAHLAFWDQRRLLLLRRWKQQGITASAIDTDLVNDTLIPFSLALPPRKAAELATSMAGELDCELESLSPEMVDAIIKVGDSNALNRFIHRKVHLDEIETLLKTKRGKAAK